MFKDLSFLIECSFGRTPTVKSLKEIIGYISKMGFTTLYLGLTDGYKIKEYPYFNYKIGGYTVEDLQELDRCGKQHGIEVVGQIQTIGHLHFNKRHAVFADLYDTDEILLIDDERVLALNEAMIRTISEGLSSRRLHIGFDEAAGTGTGRYKELHPGPIDRKVLLLRHLNRTVDIARKYGYTCEIWNDMLFDRGKGASVLTADDVKRMLPADVCMWLWEYFCGDEDILRRDVSQLKEHCTRPGFAGAVIKDASFCAQNGLAMASLIPQMKVCAEQGVEEFMITTWTNSGGQCSVAATLPALFVAAEYAAGSYQPGGEINKAKFRDICGVDFDDMWSLCLLDDPFERKPTGLTNRSHWLMLTDILFGNYDMVLSEGTAERYQALAEKYDGIDGGPFRHNFRMEAALARVLATKSVIAGKLRAAYAARDKAALTVLRDADLARLIADTRAFVKVFNEFWLDDSMPYGLEGNHMVFGQMLLRLEYAQDCLTAFIERDVPIDELEGPILPPSLDPSVNEDNLFEYRFDRFFSGYKLL